MAVPPEADALRCVAPAGSRLPAGRIGLELRPAPADTAAPGDNVAHDHQIRLLHLSGRRDLPSEDFYCAVPRRCAGRQFHCQMSLDFKFPAGNSTTGCIRICYQYLVKIADVQPIVANYTRIFFEKPRYKQASGMEPANASATWPLNNLCLPSLIGCICCGRPAAFTR